MTLNAAVNNNDRKTTKADTIKKNVIEICGYGNGTKFKVILSTGLVGDIKLKARLCEGSLTDSDEDGLSDWDEVNIELVAKYAEINSQRLEKKNGKYIIKTNNLPTIAQILSSDNWKAYTENVPDKLMRYATAAGVIDKDDWRILPINSDPTKADSDGDGLLDCIANALITKYTGQDDVRNFVYDNNPLCKDIIFEWPVKFSDGSKATNVSSSFTEYECEERNGKAHCAIDIVAPNNTPVYASVPGIVTYAGNASTWGNTVEILSVINGRIILTKYNHLNQVDVKTGDEIISANTQIGKVGNTGYSFGDHLDFIVCDIARGNEGDIDDYVGTRFTSFGTTINPLLFNKTIKWSDREEFSTDKIDIKQYAAIMNFPEELCHSCNDSNCTQCMVSANEIDERLKQL